MSIFDRCHHSWAVVTPVNYEHDMKALIILQIENVPNEEIN